MVTSLSEIFTCEFCLHQNTFDKENLENIITKTLSESSSVKYKGPSKLPHIATIVRSHHHHLHCRNSPQWLKPKDTKLLLQMVNHYHHQLVELGGIVSTHSHDSTVYLFNTCVFYIFVIIFIF